MNVYNGFSAAQKKGKKASNFAIRGEKKKNNISVRVIVVTAVRISDLGSNQNLQMVFQKFLDRI